MYRVKDFYLKKVIDLNGRKLGTIVDVVIDFYKGILLGFKVSNRFILSKRNFVPIDKVIDISDCVIALEAQKNEGIEFKSIKNMEVKNSNGTTKGAIEDIIINKGDFSIKALIVSSGFFDKLINGKKILLINDCILGENFVIYTNTDTVSFKSIPHSMECIYEKTRC
ncbi:PRC-barrel domain-containing protein [Clostridium sp. BJN0001]|uniref:PRC-barrel domain-containing protein n=1 Tax=Clostridium sp. BJN0001 TaxID=2930219 RepID=UPI001FD5D08F|nr:PRC-barrel domain-containing protein [Clostridium sp. BJN0001]